MDEMTAKKLFALALFKTPGNPYIAAKEAYPADENTQDWMVENWLNDPWVLDEIKRLKAESLVVKPRALPTKEEAIELAWNIATAEGIESKDRILALKLFAEISNYMPDKTINKNVVTETKVNKVMAYKDHGDDLTWEQKAVMQQRILANG